MLGLGNFFIACGHTKRKHKTQTETDTLPLYRIGSNGERTTRTLYQLVPEIFGELVPETRFPIGGLVPETNFPFGGLVPCVLDNSYPKLIFPLENSYIISKIALVNKVSFT